MTRDSSTRKLAALAVAGAVVLALAIAGAGATYAFLYDAETLGTDDNPNAVSAAGNIVVNCTANTGNDGCDGTSASLVVFGIPAMAGVRERRNVAADGGNRY